MSNLFKRTNGGVSRGKLGGVGLAIVGVIMAVVAILRAFGIEIPIDDDSIEGLVTAIIAVLLGLGVFGIRAAQDKKQHLG